MSQKNRNLKNAAPTNVRSNNNNAKAMNNKTKPVATYANKKQATFNNNKNNNKRDEISDDRDYGADSQESLGEEYSQEDLNGDYEDAQTSNTACPARKEMTAEEKAAEAKIQWDKVEYHFDHEFDLAEYVSDGNKGLRLKDDGMLKLSVANGLLQMGYRSHDPDFTSSAASTDTKSSRELPVNSDMVKSVHLEGFKMTGWNERVLITLSTVPKFQEEGHFGNSKNVNHLVYPHEWQTTKAQRLEIINRTITGQMLHFQRKYPGVSPENFTRDIQRAALDNYLVSLDSPMVSMINRDGAAHTESGIYNKPDLVQTNQVLIPKELVKEYKAKTLEAMSKGVSYANISDNRFEICFEAPIPSFLAAKHEEHLKNKGETGRQFLAFADTAYKTRLPLGGLINAQNGKTKDSLFKDPANRFVRVQGKAVILYKQMNEETVEDL